MAKKKDIINDILDVVYRITLLYLLYILLLWFTNKQEFWKWVFIGLGVFVVMFFIFFLRKKLIKKRKEKIAEEISERGLDKDIDNFINISGKDWGKGVWKYMDYGFNQDRMEIFRKTLVEKGIKVRDTEDLKYILKKFIDKKEESLIRGGFELKQHHFSLLSGNDFENLLVRLYGAMDYLVEHIGGNGDQGADLILTKNGQRTLIQAKCYKNLGVGNSAVQQATAAKTHYACDMAMVVGLPYFTREARELAQTNGVKLVSKKELQGLLLDYLKESWS